MLKERSLTLLYKIFIFLLFVGCSIRPLHNLHYEDVESNHIIVDVIPGKSGQKLYGFLVDFLRDIKLTDKSYKLKVDLIYKTIPYALASDGNAQRLKIVATAHIILKNLENKIILDTYTSSENTRNKSSSQSDVLMHIYDLNDESLLRELAFKIIEYIKVALNNENRV